MCTTNNPTTKTRSDVTLENHSKMRDNIKAKQRLQLRKRNAPTNFKNIKQFLDFFDSEDMCLSYFEDIRWKDGVYCPHCGLFEVWQFKNDKHTFKCATCLKQFNVKTKTIFEGGKVSMRDMFLAIYFENSFIGGLTTTEMERQLGVTRKTTGIKLNQIREYGYNQNCFPTYVETENGTAIYVLDTMARDGEDRNRHLYLKYSHGGGSNRKFILVIIQLGGYARAYVIDNVKRETMMPHILKHVPSGANLYTDEATTFGSLKNTFGHEAINHKAREFKRDEVTTNAVEGWNSFFQTGLGKFRNNFSKEYTPNYVNAAIFRYNTKFMNESEKLDLVLTNIATYMVDKTISRTKKLRTTLAQRREMLAQIKSENFQRRNANKKIKVTA